MGDTSIGPGPARGGNENEAIDPTAKTLGEVAPQRQPPAGAELLDEAAPPMPPGVPGGKAEPGIAQGPESFPDGPNVESSPWELDAARGKPPKP
jgi:hypothetical protein